MMGISSIDIKPHPPAKEVADGDGLSTASGVGATIPVVGVKWGGINWPVAFSQKHRTLWVCVDAAMVTAHGEKLDKLADAIIRHGFSKVEELVSQGVSEKDILAPLAKFDSMSKKPTSKEKALEQVLVAVRDAFKQGATLQEVRLSVFSAMGLDSDAA